MARRFRNIEGYEKVMAAFGIADAEAAKGMANALNLGGAEIATRARQLVPVGDYRGGGDLREDIQIEARALTVSHQGRRVGVSVVAGTRADTAAYARQQEFGRAPGGGGAIAEHPGHQPQPFLFPAYWSLRRRVIGRVRRALLAAVRAAARARG